MRCPADHPHRSGCYQRHKCKCDKCRAWVAALHRTWTAKKRKQQDQTKFEDWQLAVAERIYGAKA